MAVPRPLPRPLSRTCHLSDFANCRTVASWQQQLAIEAWQRWVSTHPGCPPGPSLAINWSGCGFVIPGPALHPASEQTPVSAIYGLSVVDHTEAPVSFLSHSAQRLRPAGLLVLTFAVWDAEGPDCATGHQDRVRIYDLHSWKKLVAEARRIGLVPLGGIDWEYRGSWLGDHSLGSLVLVRR